MSRKADLGQPPINSALISGTEYADKNFKFGENYRYIVRAVSLGTEGAQVESLNSNSISVSPRDVFPPSPPRVECSSRRPSPGTSLDLLPGESGVGYCRLQYLSLNRSGSAETAVDQAERRRCLTRTTFQDDKVESGKTYYYYLTAVDPAGNVSQPSEVVSETGSLN